MKNKSLAIALLASLPLFAHAQTNVTMYGLLDGSIGVEDDGVNSTTVSRSGTQSTSRLGFRGTEDLGNGLKAIFNIEAGVAVDTGAGDSVLFGRRAVVGLEGAFGSVTIGREYSPIAAVALAGDPLGQGFYGTNLAAFTGNRLTRRLSNSVNYKSNSLNGFKVLAAYSTGEKATGPSGDLMGAAVEYANGPLYVGGGYHQVERLASGDDKEYAFGVGYKIGDLELKGSWLEADLEAANKYTMYTVGGSKGFGPGRLFLGVHQNKLNNGAKANGWSVAYSYALSKRTNLYSSFASLRNNGAGQFGLTSAGATLNPGAVGADPRTFNIGVRHFF